MILRAKIASYLQLEKRKVCVGVVCFLFALLDNIFLEDAGGLRVVSIEAIQNGIDVLGPVRRVIESNPHSSVFIGAVDSKVVVLVVVENTPRVSSWEFSDVVGCHVTYISRCSW